jgi:alkaline phosphatase D
MTNRRRFLRRASLAAGGAALGALGVQRRPVLAAPGLLTSDDARPGIPCGAAVGDVASGHAVVWSKTDRPARLLVEYATNDAFRDSRRIVGPAALPETDFTARVVLTQLPASERLSYRVVFQDLTEPRRMSLPAAGSFVTAPDGRRDIVFAWSADTAGQGFGINPDWGGMKLYETMRLARPDFFVHCGDTIYADNPLEPELRLDDGTVWRNLVTPSKAKVAETLDEFRGNYRYNFLDDNVRRFNAEVPCVALWDDHEVLNNWHAAKTIDDARYRERSVPSLAARARRAFLEYMPIRTDAAAPERIYRSLPYGPSLEVFVVDIRSHRGPNGPGRQPASSAETALLGAAQLQWLKAGLAASRAAWKAVVIGVPLGLTIADDFRNPGAGFESIANGDGPPLGRELEIAELLRFLRERHVRNVVWLTGDVHYAAAHHYDPARARFKDFDPFWEFVAGPINAGTFGPNALDDTFGPQARFVAVPAGMKPNRPPSAGLQFFGTVRIDGKTEVLTVKLHDLAGRVLFTLDLPPER